MSAERRVRDVVSVLGQRLGPDRILTEPEQFRRYPGLTWLPPRRLPPRTAPVGPPAAIVRPRDAADVALVLREASQGKVPVVPYGGGTGVMGGVLPVAGGIVLDLGALNRILAIEPVSRLARVEAGVVLGDLARKAEAQGLLFAHDPWSQPIATVGGAIGTSGMGYLAAGYGSFSDQVRGLEVVLPTGEIVQWPGIPKTATGPDLSRLFVGAEGTLGVVTSAVIQLFPWPEARALAAFRFPTFAAGVQAVAQFGAIGLRPAMVDLEEEEGPPLETVADLHLAFDGPVEVVRAGLRRAGRICREHSGINRGRAAAERFWNERHASVDWYRGHVAAVAAGEEPEPPSTDEEEEMRYLCVAVPGARVLDYCAQVVAIARENGVAAHTFAVWARPELLSLILEGPSNLGPDSPLDRIAGAVLRLAHEEGGTMEWCHGVGLRLVPSLEGELGPRLGLLRRIKRTLDPAGILNPGKLGLGLDPGAVLDATGYPL